MLIKTDLNKSVDKKTFKEEMAVLEKRLSSLQQTIIDRKIPLLIVFEGWEAAGKGTHISRLVYPLDPRYFNVYPGDEGMMRPFLWMSWVRSPGKGQITIYDKSWSRAILPENLSKRRLNEFEITGFYHDVNAFEQQLTDAGTLIVKLFLHISQDEQRKRFKAMEKSKETAWRVKESDWEQNEHYDQNIRSFEKMLKQTNTAYNPWHIIESNNKRYATLKIYKTIIERIETHLSKLDTQSTEEKPSAQTFNGPRILRKTNPYKNIGDDEYKERLKELQSNLNMLGHKLYMKRRPVIIAYEGWDAAGKGGNIKRLTEELDPRSYEVVPISAPTQEELAHHYLWRFYKQMPKDGHFTIFDRTWYGRVLVERVEQLTPEPVWRRAYHEINDMEAHIIHHGTILFKFWLHIDKDEQLKRFQARQNDPLKQYKITEEDWRNRDKWDQYELAIDEMLTETSTPQAPWTIVESNNKKFARIKVLETVVDTLDDALR